MSENTTNVSDSREAATIEDILSCDTKDEVNALVADLSDEDRTPAVLEAQQLFADADNSGDSNESVINDNDPATKVDAPVAPNTNKENTMSTIDKSVLGAAFRSIDVGDIRRTSKNNTYVIMKPDADCSDMAPQAQVIWKALVACCKELGTDRFTDKDAEFICTELKKAEILETGQPPKRIFKYYASIGAKGGAAKPGFLAKRWLLKK